MPDVADPLVEAAKRYLKSRYGEDTVSMTVIRNTVEKGTGTLSVECTVSYGGDRSDWTKQFHFRGGKVETMNAQPK